MLQAQNPELRAIQETYTNPFHVICEDISIVKGVHVKCYVSRNVGELSEVEKNFLVLDEMFHFEVKNWPPDHIVARYGRAILAWNDGKGRKDFGFGDTSGYGRESIRNQVNLEVAEEFLEKQTKGNPSLPSPWQYIGLIMSQRIREIQEDPDLVRMFESNRILAHEIGQRAGWLSPLVAQDHGVYGR
jgi:hypothetical protein